MTTPSDLPIHIPNFGSDSDFLNIGNKKYTILFVDDEPDILKTMVRIFRSEERRVGKECRL